jgi:carboxyl-terminal processing protease
MNTSKTICRTAFHCLFVLCGFAFFGAPADAIAQLPSEEENSTAYHRGHATSTVVGHEFAPSLLVEHDRPIGRAGPLEGGQTRTALRPREETPNFSNPGSSPSLFTDTPPVPGLSDEAPIHEAVPVDVKLTSRYSESSMIGFVRSTSMSQLASIYNEVSQLIDSRHVSPPSYEARTSQALMSIVNALDNPAFLNAAGVQGNTGGITQVQSALADAARNQPARSAQEAVSLMQWAAELANRTAGVSRTAVGVEFINGTLDSLDQFSSFVPDDSYSAPSASLEENIVGIGVELKTHAQGALLTGVVEGGPASEIGLQAGDIITSVDGRDMGGLTLNQVAGAISGRAGSQITMVIEREGRRYRADLVRRSVYVSSVTGTRMLDEQSRIGYVRLRQFSESSKEDMEKAMWTLYNQGMQTLVLDLRGNPGGLLDEAIDLCDLFLPCGTIVSTRGRNQSDNSSETATNAQTWAIPLIVLIDGGSASASEIFAAAIQENDRGVIVGRRSYGKGTVQTHFPLRAASANVKLTTAMFYSPTGRQMAGEGVIPDVTVTGQERSAASVFEDYDVQQALQIAATDLPRRMSEDAAVCRVRTGRPELYGTAP